MDKRSLGTMAIKHTTAGSSDDSSGGDQRAETLFQKRDRIKKELAEAGMTAYGLRKFNSRYLPTIIHDQEHVKAVIYGRYVEGSGLLQWADRMVVATDRRIISLNHKPGYTDEDEFTYDVVDGVDASTAGPFTAVTLNTKISSLIVRFINRRCAEKFVHYVEKRRLEYARLIA